MLSLVLTKYPQKWGLNIKFLTAIFTNTHKTNKF